MAFETSATERIRIVCGGDVGIGTTVPDSILHVYTGAGGAAADSAADEFHLESSSSTVGMTISGPASNEGNIFFADDSSSTVGRITYAHAANCFYFTTNSVAALYIDSAQNVGFGAPAFDTQSAWVSMNYGFNATIVAQCALGAGNGFWLVQNARRDSASCWAHINADEASAIAQSDGDITFQTAVCAAADAQAAFTAKMTVGNTGGVTVCCFMGIGIAAGSTVQLCLGGDFDGVNVIANKGTICAPANNSSIYANDFRTTLVTSGSAGTHANYAQMRINAPTPVCVTTAATITNAAAISIFDTTAGATNNYQIFGVDTGGYFSTAGVWTDDSNRDGKREIVTANEVTMLEILRTLEPKQFYRRKPDPDYDSEDDSTSKYLDENSTDDPYLHYGVIAQDAPEAFHGDTAGESVAAGYVSGFLLAIAQNLDARLSALE